MATLPSGYVVSTTGVYTSFPTEKVGAVMYGVTSATTSTGRRPTVMQALAIKDGVPTAPVSQRKTRVVAVSGTNHTYSTQNAISSGTFAYDGGRANMLINSYSTKINGMTNRSLQIVGADTFRQRRNIKNKDRGQGYGTAFRAGYFSFTGVANKRTAWSTNPTALTNAFQSTTSSADASDQAQYVTWRTIPGELVYMGASGVAPKLDDYKASTG